MLNTMIQSRNEMRKTRSKKGFTLMEMLIVVAIIAILVAIAIPTFSAQLDKAREATDSANLRSAKGIAVSTYLLEDETGAAVTYSVYTNAGGNLMVVAGTTLPTGGTALTGEATANSEALTITVNNGEITGTSWDAAAG